MSDPLSAIVACDGWIHTYAPKTGRYVSFHIKDVISWSIDSSGKFTALLIDNKSVEMTVNSPSAMAKLMGYPSPLSIWTSANRAFSISAVILLTLLALFAWMRM